MLVFAVQLQIILQPPPKEGKYPHEFARSELKLGGHGELVALEVESNVGAESGVVRTLVLLLSKFRERRPSSGDFVSSIRFLQAGIGWTWNLCTWK